MQSLFGTPLFEANEQGETVERFKVSTIIFCVITYVLSFLLIWLADKWDSAGSLYHQARSIWGSSWARLKGKRVDDSGFRSKDEVHMTPDGTDRKMSV